MKKTPQKPIKEAEIAGAPPMGRHCLDRWCVVRRRPQRRGSLDCLHLCLEFDPAPRCSAIYHRVHWTPERRAWMRRRTHHDLCADCGELRPSASWASREPSQTGCSKLSGASLSERFTISSAHAPKWIMAVLCSVVGLTAVVARRYVGAIGPGLVIWILAEALLHYRGRDLCRKPSTDRIWLSRGLSRLSSPLRRAIVAFKLYIFDPLASA